MKNYYYLSSGNQMASISALNNLGRKAEESCQAKLVECRHLGAPYAVAPILASQLISASLPFSPPSQISIFLS